MQKPINITRSLKKAKLSSQKLTLKAPETRPETSGRVPSLAITEPTIPKRQTNFRKRFFLILAYKTPCIHLRERHRELISEISTLNTEMQHNNPTNSQILFHRKTKEPKLRWHKFLDKAIEIKGKEGD